MWSMPIRQATSAPVPEGEEREQRFIGHSPLGCVGTGTDDHNRRMSVLCYLHRRLPKVHMDLSHEDEERSVYTLPKVQTEVKKTTSRHVRCLRSNGGKEYFSDAFTAYLRHEGIRREFTC